MTNQNPNTQHGGVKSGKEDAAKMGKRHEDAGERRHLNETQSGDAAKRANDVGTQRNIDENRGARDTADRPGQDNWNDRDAARSNERDREDREGDTRFGGAREGRPAKADHTRDASRNDREPDHATGQMDQDRGRGAGKQHQ
ncbi:MAG: hypothetical protein IT535_08165 [Bauldia sp.]|nr:hypothetical protein [Bauldia sp.]